MFGYTLPQYNRMTASDLATYQKYYCEGCHQLKSGFGLVSTTTVNYDMTFNTMILNSIAGDVIDFEGTRKTPLCVFNAPKNDSDLMREMAAYTVLLTKWELVDDDEDSPSLKTNFISLTLGRAIEKAERMYPEYDDIIGRGFENLQRLESDGCRDAIKMGSEFGRSLSLALNDFAGDKGCRELEEVFVQLSTLVYVLDAIDDLDEDFLADTYNPFLEGHEEFMNKSDYISKNIYSLSDTINEIIGGLQKSYGSIRADMRSCTGSTDNIVYHGLPTSAKNVLTGSSMAKASVKNILKGHKERNRSD